MSRESIKYLSILDGTSIVDEDTSGDPEFHGYVRPGGTWIISKHTSSTGKYVYALGKDLDGTLTLYDVAWTNRATIGYLRPGTLKAL